MKVMPQSGVSRIEGVRGGELVVRLCAPPEKGKANRELLEVLAAAVGLARSALRIVTGETARHKVVALPVTVKGRLEQILSATTGSRHQDEDTAR